MGPKLRGPAPSRSSFASLVYAEQETIQRKMRFAPLSAEIHSDAREESHKEPAGVTATDLSSGTTYVTKEFLSGQAAGVNIAPQQPELARIISHEYGHVLNGHFFAHFLGGENEAEAEDIANEFGKFL
jgi:hypothetical protein